MADEPRCRRRIGIVYPFSSLDSVPSLRNTAFLLAEQGYWVDIYTWRDGRHIPPAFEHERISVLSAFDWLSTVGSRGLVPGSLYWPVQALLRHRRAPYHCLIGVDPMGLLWAKGLTYRVPAPLVYYSVELLLSHEVRRWRDRKVKAWEKALSQEAAFVIIQDDERAALLARDNGLAVDRIITVPNAPLGPARRGSSDLLRERLDLPRDSKIVLHAGSIGDWACTRQLIESTLDWPDDWVLVFHTRRRLTRDSPLLAGLPRDLATTQRVRLSTDPVPYDEFPSLVRSADIGIAFYCVRAGSTYTQDNIRHVGLSSGKLAYYLQAGVPVIVNDIPSLRRLAAEYRCGEVARIPSATYDAIHRVLADYESYSRGAMDCFNREFDFAGRFQAVLEAIERL